MRQTREAKIKALAQTGDYNPEEAANAQRILDNRSLMLISNAERALAEAQTLGEMRDVHTMAKALQAGAKAHGLGIEAENKAAAVIIKAQVAMGQELIRMATDGERAVRGVVLGTVAGQGKKVLPAGEVPPTMAALGINYNDASRWQTLARDVSRLDAGLFEQLLERAQHDLEGRVVRLSQAPFVELVRNSLPPGDVPKPKGRIAPPAETVDEAKSTDFGPAYRLTQAVNRMDEAADEVYALLGSVDLPDRNEYRVDADGERYPVRIPDDQWEARIVRATRTAKIAVALVRRLEDLR